MGANATKLLASLQTAYEDDPSKVNKLVEKIFTMFDKDKSGQLQGEEVDKFMQAFVTAYEVEKLDGVYHSDDNYAYKAVIALIDSNKDGCFSLQELQDGLVKLLQMASKSDMNAVIEKMQKDMVASEQYGKSMCREKGCTTTSFSNVLKNGEPICMQHLAECCGSDVITCIDDTLILDGNVHARDLQSKREFANDVFKALANVQKLQKVVIKNFADRAFNINISAGVKLLFGSVGSLKEVHLIGNSITADFSSLSLSELQKLEKLVMTGNRGKEHHDIPNLLKQPNLQEIIAGGNVAEKMAIIPVPYGDIILKLLKLVSNEGSAAPLKHDDIEFRYKSLFQTEVLAFTLDCFEPATLTKVATYGLSNLAKFPHFKKLDLGFAATPTCVEEYEASLEAFAAVVKGKEAEAKVALKAAICEFNKVADFNEITPNQFLSAILIIISLSNGDIAQYLKLKLAA